MLVQAPAYVFATTSFTVAAASLVKHCTVSALHCSWVRNAMLIVVLHRTRLMAVALSCIGSVGYGLSLVY